jgi:hypothetical protein
MKGQEVVSSWPFCFLCTLTGSSGKFAILQRLTILRRGQDNLLPGERNNACAHNLKQYGT